MTSTVSMWDKNDTTIDITDKTDTPDVRLLVLDENGNPDKEVLPDGNGTEVPFTPLYAITFDAAGGLVEPSSMTTESDGKLASLPVPSYTGYTFEGWYTLPDGGEKVTADTIFTHNATLYAKWTKKDYGDVQESDIPSDGNIPKGIWTAGIQSAPYTGKAVKQTFRIYDNLTLLQEGRDYTVS